MCRHKQVYGMPAHITVYIYYWLKAIKLWVAIKATVMSLRAQFNSLNEAVPEPGGLRPDAAVPSSRQDSLWAGWFEMGSLWWSRSPSFYTDKCRRPPWIQLHPFDALSTFHHTRLWWSRSGYSHLCICSTVKVGEYCGVHAEGVQPVEEEEPLSCCFSYVVCVVSPGHVLIDVKPEEPEAADSLHLLMVTGVCPSFVCRHVAKMSGFCGWPRSCAQTGTTGEVQPWGAPVLRSR